jgi:hypothetical protein
MIGCIVFTAFLAVMAVKFFHHRRLCGAGPHGWHRHPWGWHGRHWDLGGPWHGFGPGPRSEGRWMWAVLARLDLSPAQERVVRSELETLKQKLKAARGEGAQSRSDLARAVRGEDFEEGALASMFIRHDERLHDLRQDLGGALGRIHAVLDPAQRERLADLIERGPSRMAWGGPYREHHGPTTEV